MWPAVKVSVAVRKELEGKAFISAYSSTSQSVIKRRQDEASSRAGVWRQELCRDHGSAAYRLVSNGLLGLFPYRTQYHLQRGATRGEPVPLKSVISRENAGLPTG